ncbi:MAG: hydrogenase nickel incorporation protein HypB [Sedimentisphaerales bacterium]|nr:hydrogenase nickel incorporation protein HypB [Sedimentisphaerales bacterium]
MRKVIVEKKILVANEEFANKNREFLTAKKLPCLNVISSPGSGKTTILAKTIEALKGKVRIGVIEGDIQTDIDARRIRKTGAPACQINTEGACHLSAAQVSFALHKLPVDTLDLIFIENVGNLVCPSALDLGETAKIAVLSTPEGDDKPAKYPAIFARAAVVLINKIDLLAAGDFNIEKAGADVFKINKKAKIFPVSAKTGQGMSAWCDWLEEMAAKKEIPA